MSDGNSRYLSDSNLADRIFDLKHPLHKIIQYLNSPKSGCADCADTITALDKLLGEFDPSTKKYADIIKNAENLQRLFGTTLDIVEKSEIANYPLNVPTCDAVNNKTLLRALEDLDTDFDLLRCDYDTVYREQRAKDVIVQEKESSFWKGGIVGFIAGTCLIFGICLKAFQKSEPQPASTPIPQVAPAIPNAR